MNRAPLLRRHNIVPMLKVGAYKSFKNLPLGMQKKEVKIFFAPPLVSPSLKLYFSHS
jgi:hypothetical protein